MFYARKFRDSKWKRADRRREHYDNPQEHKNSLDGEELDTGDEEELITATLDRDPVPKDDVPVLDDSEDDDPPPPLPPSRQESEDGHLTSYNNREELQPQEGWSFDLDDNRLHHHLRMLPILMEGHKQVVPLSAEMQTLFDKDNTVDPDGFNPRNVEDMELPEIVWRSKKLQSFNWVAMQGYFYLREIGEVDLVFKRLLEDYERCRSADCSPQMLKDFDEDYKRWALDPRMNDYWIEPRLMDKDDPITDFTPTPEACS